ncbi:MAG: YheU family protein [Burkholderiales bacterium]
MTERPTEAVIVPHAELSDDALRGVIESFVLREGTDYGEREFSLEQKVAHVLRQLQRGEARIVFDPASGSIDIVQDRDRAAPGQNA